MDDDEPMPRCIQGGHLRLEGEHDGNSGFDPDEVTRLIGLEPSWKRRRGESLGADGRPLAAGSSWRIDVAQRDTTHTEALVRELLDIVEPYADGMAQARRALGLSAGIYISVIIYDQLSVPQVQFRVSTLRRLAALELWFWCEQDIHF
ncbi:DUF4279 domain-containing protein [Dactylosporangium aurantiacum]|uniref:DUF4279 domain-containing protein n=1 Tax=Dactylosporangium aurantiacum TaxID=35754 RepID=A0A9Q9I8T1_9ACTN|nr:DUF4279 domain-containing protein [Dactylosporangium aurantiacum]MDG6107204.1 DUF4279 domain-containing protein [Dactylosporangium aurantiacum]UWZ51497.1 DUF4279 domain-containing protein [Dactylosporangium aurantiacum]